MDDYAAAEGPEALFREVRGQLSSFDLARSHGQDVINLIYINVFILSEK